MSLLAISGLCFIPLALIAVAWVIGWIVSLAADVGWGGVAFGLGVLSVIVSTCAGAFFFLAWLGTS